MHLVILVSHLRQSKFMPCKPHQVLTMHPNAHQMCANTPTSARPILIILFSIFKLQFFCPMLSHGAPWCPMVSPRSRLPGGSTPPSLPRRRLRGKCCVAGDPHPAGAACSLKADLGYRLDTLQLGYRQSVVCDNQWCGQYWFYIGGTALLHGCPMQATHFVRGSCYPLLISTS